MLKCVELLGLEQWEMKKYKKEDLPHQEIDKRSFCRSVFVSF